VVRQGPIKSTCGDDANSPDSIRLKGQNREIVKGTYDG